MTAIELKKLLVHRIAEINDISFLKAIKIILDSKTETEVLVLSAEQKAEILKSKNEIEKGLFIDQDKLDKEISKWASVG
jgi:uncharacterized protein YktA (UPF0223 family)